MKLRVTVSFEYEWEPHQYGTTDAVQAALTDEDAFRDDPDGFIEFMVYRVHEAKFRVEPVPHRGEGRPGENEC